MSIAPANLKLFSQLKEDKLLRTVLSVDDLARDYDAISVRFHSYFSEGIRMHFIENAAYHKSRYLDLLATTFTGAVLDIGNDKPFTSYFLRSFNPAARFCTVSFDIPETPVDLYAVDIESDPLPFADSIFDWAIFTEVIEHMWRDPSHAIAQINRVLRLGGKLFLTTPNPCELHALTCVLWQANPNPRGQYFANLESGHLHLWSIPDLRLILGAHGFLCDEVTTKNYYGYTGTIEKVVEFVKEVSPYIHLMGESIVIVSTKTSIQPQAVYPSKIFPNLKPVAFDGALRAFALRKLAEEAE